jgi:hypothetical protein
MFAQVDTGGTCLSNQSISMAGARRPGRTALDEFLPESDLRLDSRQAHLDPADVQLEPGAFSVESTGGLRVKVAQDNSQVQWWPMLAAALVAIGVSLLAFGAWARFGQI